MGPRSTLTFYALDMTVETASRRVATYNRLAARIEELGLPAAVDAKPILDVRIVPLSCRCFLDVTHRALTIAFGVFSFRLRTHRDGRW